MIRARARSFALIVSVSLVALGACMTDHDALQKQPNQGAGGAGASGVSGSGNVGPTSGSGGGGATGGHPDDEAPGTSVLTIVHGVVDAPSVIVCWAKVGASGVAVPFGEPVTLAYGENLVFPTITGADPAADVLEPLLIAGELDLVSGLDCADAVQRARAEEPAQIETGNGAAGAAEGGSPSAGGEGGAVSSGGASTSGGSSSGGTLDTGGTSGIGAGGEGGAPSEVAPRLRARALAAIPAGTLNGGRSYLLVAAGCMGGSSFDAPNAEQYCGTGYTERTPTVSMMFVALSRATAVDQVGLQVLNASLATDPIDVNSVSPASAPSTPISIVQSDVEGGLLPRPAYIDHGVNDYGVTLGHSLEVTARRKVPSGTGTVTQDVTIFSESWANALGSGGSLVNGSNFAIVLLGPLADAKAGAAFWNAPVITVVSSDPK
jgi:hypothetical protein